MTATTSSPVRVLCDSSAWARLSTCRRFSLTISSVRLSSVPRLSSIRSASARRRSASGSWPFFRRPPWAPPGAPTSSRFAVEYDDTVEPIAQKSSMNVTTVADRCDQGLVHRVLDRRAGRVWRDDGELVHLLVAQLVPHLRQVALVGADSASLGWITDLKDPVDAARPQQRLVKSLRQVCRHHDQDPVPGRRLRAHPEDPSHVAIHEAAGLLQPGKLG